MHGVVTIYHNPLNKWLHVICSGEFTTSEFQQTLLNSVQALKEHGCQYMILDCQLAWGAGNIYDWINSQWIDLAEENGLRHLAFVYGTDYPQMFDHDLWVSRMGFYPCQNLTSAVNWLTRENQPPPGRQ
jgi:hypothetical protein